MSLPLITPQQANALIGDGAKLIDIAILTNMPASIFPPHSPCRWTPYPAH